MCSWQPIRFLVAATVPVAVVAGLVPLRAHIDSANLALGLVIVVLASAYRGGRLGGTVSALASAIAFDFFLTRPRSGPCASTLPAISRRQCCSRSSVSSPANWSIAPVEVEQLR